MKSEKIIIEIYYLCSQSKKGKESDVQIISEDDVQSMYDKAATLEVKV